MRKLLGVGFFLVIGVSLSLTGCLDTPNFDNTPSIRYNDVDGYTIFDGFSRVKKDTVIITVDFEDGDGDIGAPLEARKDTLPPDGKYQDWGDYRLRMFKKDQKGDFVELNLSVDKYKWIPVLKPDGKPGPIKGKLDLGSEYFHATGTKPTVVKFKVQIRDRALRVSNEIETDTVTVQMF